MFRALRATAPQTYYTFRASNGAADVLYVLLKSLTALGLQACLCLGFENMGARVEFAVDKSTRMFQFVKTTADVRHHLSTARISPQTCDKNKIEFLEVNFYDNKKSSDYIGFTDVFEFSSDLKKR